MENREKFITATMLFICLFSVSIVVLLLAFLYAIGHEKTPDLSKDLIIISLLSLILSVIGTFSTLILGWRNEIRKTTETKLKIEKLELEIAELKLNREKEENKLRLIIK